MKFPNPTVDLKQSKDKKKYSIQSKSKNRKSDRVTKNDTLKVSDLKPLLKDFNPKRYRNTNLTTSGSDVKEYKNDLDENYEEICQEYEFLGKQVSKNFSSIKNNI